MKKKFYRSCVSMLLTYGETKSIKELVDMAQSRTGGTEDGLAQYPIVYIGDGDQYLTVG